jgi:hypothetical protein
LFDEVLPEVFIRLIPSCYIDEVFFSAPELGFDPVDYAWTFDE